MKRCVGLLLLALVCFAGAQASVPNLKWLEESYDFGTMTEEEGPQKGFVRFVNTSATEPLVVKRVRATCGCTEAYGPSAPVAPGDTATINFTYDPTGRPGAFRKSIRVSFVGGDEAEVIKLYGTVVGEIAVMRSGYPIEVGPLRLSMRIADFGDLDQGESRQMFISGYNSSTDTIRPKILPTDVPEVPGEPRVNMLVVPDVVPPGESLTVSIFLFGNDETVPGPWYSNRTLCVGDDCIDLSLSANIVPKVKAVSASELANYPQLTIPGSAVEFKANSKGVVKPSKFSISNSGGSDLHVRKITSDNDDIIVKSYPHKLAKGESGDVTIELNPARVAGDDIVAGYIYVVTDDPMQPVRKIRYAFSPLRLSK